MMYHKIQTVFFRDPATNYRTLLGGQYSLPEFEYLRNAEWEFTEKIDGTNIRVIWDGENISFAGKTDKSEIPLELFTFLTNHFTEERMKQMLGPCVLYGEGFGSKIQKGEAYSVAQSFILFDATPLDGSIWLTRETINKIAEDLEILAVPVVGTGTLDDAIYMCKQGFDSVISDRPRNAEGLVMRPKIELLNRRGRRIITKLKLKDF